MDIYLFSVIVGAVGLSWMAVAGLSHHGGGSHHGAVGHHGGGAHHGGGHTHASAGHHHDSPGGAGSAMGVATWMLMTPRLLFAILLGFGMIGVAFQSWIGGTILLLVAIGGGILVERLIVNPLWKFAMRFVSNPATTLASATMAEAVVVSSFDKNGQGIISFEVDGHVQQVLATLQESDRAAGVRIRAGESVRIEEVDEARQRCIVSKMA